MKKSSTIFLQIIILVLGIGVLALMLWEPHLEGRNAHATLFEIYFKDPFLAYAYIGSIPFFVALYHASKVLGYVRRNMIFSQTTVNAMRTIKYCALIMVGTIIGADTYLMIVARLPGNTDDPAGAVMLGIVATIASIVIAIAAAVFERILQNAVDMKTENDLTV